MRVKLDDSLKRIHLYNLKLEEMVGGLYFHNYASGTGLMAKWREALERIEEMCYAVFGAVPDYVNQVDWWQRPNPRCLWPEMINRWLVFGP